MHAQSSFKEVGASDEIVKALRSIGIERPSFIQAAAYQVLMSGARHIVLADHAGAADTPSCGLSCDTFPAMPNIACCVLWNFAHLCHGRTAAPCGAQA